MVDSAQQHPLAEVIVHGTAMQRRRGMAKAITLLESTRSDHRAQGDALLTDFCRIQAKHFA